MDREPAEKDGQGGEGGKLVLLIVLLLLGAIRHWITSWPQQQGPGIHRRPPPARKSVVQCDALKPLWDEFVALRKKVPPRPKIEDFDAWAAAAVYARYRKENAEVLDRLEAIGKQVAQFQSSTYQEEREQNFFVGKLVEVGCYPLDTSRDAKIKPCPLKMEPEPSKPAPTPPDG